jgi:predicted deacylase
LEFVRAERYGSSDAVYLESEQEGNELAGEIVGWFVFRRLVPRKESGSRHVVASRFDPQRGRAG